METNNATREPARDRFAAQEHFLDIEEAAKRLLSEPDKGQNGHRQIALHKTSHTTIALFVFEPGGRIPQHRAHGAVIIQTLQGRLRVATTESNHTLSPGQVLVLAPDVPHDVTAEEASRMLLTVSLAPPKV